MPPLIPDNLWEHQWEEIRDHSLDPARALFWEPRTGKTRTIANQLVNLDAHLGTGPQVLVVAPQIASRTWQGELNNVGIYTENLCYGAVRERLGLLRDLYESATRVRRTRPRHMVAVIVNYDALYNMREDLRSYPFDALVCDESHYIKTPGSRRSRAMHRIAPSIPWRRILTGTPDPKDYVDYYSQYKVLDPRIFGTNLNLFRNQYVNAHPLYPSKVLSYKNVDELRSKIFSVASRIRRRDCLSLPEETFETRHLTMPQWMMSQYRSAGMGENSLTALLRKQQFLANFKPKEVVKEVESWLAADRKVVVFFRFREEEDKIVLALKSAYPGVPVYTLDGDTPQSGRELVEQEFAPGKEVGAAVCVCSIAMGVSINLSAADCDIVSTPDFDFNHYEQSKARIWKQNGRVYHVDLVYTDSYDTFVQRNLRRKRNISQSLLDSAGLHPESAPNSGRSRWYTYNGEDLNPSPVPTWPTSPAIHIPRVTAALGMIEEDPPVDEGIEGEDYGDTGTPGGL